MWLSKIMLEIHTPLPHLFPLSSCSHKHTHTNTYIFKYVHTHWYLHVYTSMYMYTYTYTHTHTHTDLSRHRYTHPYMRWCNNFGTFKTKVLKANKRQRARTSQITFCYDLLPSDKNILKWTKKKFKAVEI